MRCLWCEWYGKIDRRRKRRSFLGYDKSRIRSRISLFFKKRSYVLLNRVVTRDIQWKFFFDDI